MAAKIMMLEVEAKTVEGDMFRGVYSTLPTRREYIADLVGSDLPTEALTRLLKVVQRVLTWPRNVNTKRIEVAFENRRRIGTVTFDRVRTKTRYDVFLYGKAAK